MEQVISLLNQKNQHLEKFFDLNESEMDNFRRAQFTNIETFYQSRETILDVIRIIDENIEKLNQQEPTSGPTQEQRGEVQDLLAITEDLVKEILNQDLQILSFVEQAKTEIIRELQGVRRNRKAVSAYRSPNVIPLLDEEL
jgi:hypothetical protein